MIAETALGRLVNVGKPADKRWQMHVSENNGSCMMHFT